MKQDMPEGRDNELSRLLCGSRPATQLPPRFAEGVWRRIETAEARTIAESPGWLELLLTRVLRPRLALVAVGMLIITGAVLGVHNGTHVAQQQSLNQYLASVAPNPLR
jgi:hypothetical protein